MRGDHLQSRAWWYDAVKASACNGQNKASILKTGGFKNRRTKTQGVSNEADQASTPRISYPSSNKTPVRVKGVIHALGSGSVSH